MMIVNVHVAVSSANIRRSPGGECAVVKNQSLKWYRQISKFYLLDNFCVCFLFLLLSYLLFLVNACSFTYRVSWIYSYPYQYCHTYLYFNSIRACSDTIVLSGLKLFGNKYSSASGRGHCQRRTGLSVFCVGGGGEIYHEHFSEILTRAPQRNFGNCGRKI